MCNCIKKKEFETALFQAIAFERASKKEAAIFMKDGVISFTDKSNIDKIEGICCYSTTDRVEHKIVVAKVAKKAPKKKKAVKEIEVDISDSKEDN